MKNITKKELHTKSSLELEKQLHDAKNTLRLMRFEHAQGRIKNTSSIAKKKNEIAVMGTIVNEKSVVKEEVAAKDEVKKEKAVEVKIKKSKGGKNE